MKLTRPSFGASLVALVAVAWLTGSPVPARGDDPHPAGDGDDGAEDHRPEGTPPAVRMAPTAAMGRAPAFRAGMIRVVGGTFTAGRSDPHAPFNEHAVGPFAVAPYWIDRTEVTVGAYRACVTGGACTRPRKASPACTYDGSSSELPVSCVSWAEAAGYCRWRGKVLPTELQWELAARGAAALVGAAVGAAPGPLYPWGSTSPSCFHALTLVHDGTARSCGGAPGPAPVGSHPAGASPFGLQDMTGNVEEWMADDYVEARVVGPPARGGASHTLRGGGWMTPPSAATTTARSWGSALEAGPNVGFRCAQDRGGPPGVDTR